MRFWPWLWQLSTIKIEWNRVWLLHFSPWPILLWLYSLTRIYGRHYTMSTFEKYQNLQYMHKYTCILCGMRSGTFFCWPWTQNCQKWQKNSSPTFNFSFWDILWEWLYWWGSLKCNSISWFPICYLGTFSPTGSCGDGRVLSTILLACRYGFSGTISPMLSISCQFTGLGRSSLANPSIPNNSVKPVWFFTISPPANTLTTLKPQ